MKESFSSASSLGVWVVSGVLLLPIVALIGDVQPAWPSQTAGKVGLSVATIVFQLGVLSVISTLSLQRSPQKNITLWVIAGTVICLISYLVLLTLFTLQTEHGRVVTGYSYASAEVRELLEKYYLSDLEALRNSAYNLERLWSTGSLAVTRLSIMVSWFGWILGLTYLVGIYVPYQKIATVPLIDRRVFISYRRSDSADILGRIYDRLTQRIGADKVFKDVNSIPLGADFPQLLRETISNSDVVLCVIGPEWESVTDKDGIPRITSGADFVHLEILNALEQSIPTIPVLVARNDMPDTDSFPRMLRALDQLNAIQIRPDPDFERDVDRLIDAIEKYPKRPKPGS